MAVSEVGDDGAASPGVFSLAIGGMSCGSCAARIERRLNELDGVDAAVSYAAERARVVLRADQAIDAVLREIEAIGFTADVRDALEPPIPAEDDARRRVRGLKVRLLVVGVLFMPLCDLSLAFSLIPSLRFVGWQWVLVGLVAPVVTWGAFPFYEAAVRNVRHRTLTMDSLVSMGIVVATGWSVYAMFWQDTSRQPHSLWYVLWQQSGGAVYVDVAAGVTTFVLAGRLFEAISKRRAGSALRSLAQVAAKDVTMLSPTGTEHRLPVGHLAVGDEFVVRPGETVATDGEVVFGHASIDRSAMTGESLPEDVGSGDSVLGGTVVAGGRLIVRATGVGRNTQLARMMQLVADAQSRKAAIQGLADRISAIFVPTVFLIAVTTLSAWLIAGSSVQHSLSAAISVLIIACPCALGLATPAALLVASGTGASMGIFFKSPQALERSRQVDTVVIDKTGTVTSGRMSVRAVACAPGVIQRDLLRWAGAVEQASEHLVGRAISAAAMAELGELPVADDFEAHVGAGVSGVVDGHRIVVGRARAVLGDGGLPDCLRSALRGWESCGWSDVVVSCDTIVIGAVAVADSIRPTAAAAVHALEVMGLRCILLTGDSEAAARTVGHAIGISEVIADALPTEKVDRIEELRRQGRSVAMVGDGVNDGAALIAADLGLAIGSGTDVAINAADLIVVRDDLTVVATAIELARRTFTTIRGNLVWAFAYNVVAIPLAAMGLLNPVIAAAAMALSSGFVIWNSARLRSFGGDGGTVVAPSGGDEPRSGPAASSTVGTDLG